MEEADKDWMMIRMVGGLMFLLVPAHPGSPRQRAVNSCCCVLLCIVATLPSVLWLCWLGGRKGMWPVKNMGGWWRWTKVSPDGVAPSRMVGVSASVNLPLHHKVQKLSSGTVSPGWSRKKGHKMVVVVYCGFVASM